MNRKGSLEWSMETVGKLVFYALILLAIFWMSAKLIDIFVSGEKDFRAKRNLEFLDKQVLWALETGQEQSVIVNVPPERLLIGFDKGETHIIHVKNEFWRSIFPALNFLPTGEEICTGEIARPAECDDGACLCMVRFTVETQQDPERLNVLSCHRPILQSIECKEYHGVIQRIEGTTGGDLEIDTGKLVDWNLHLRGDEDDQDLFVLGWQHGPMNIHIIPQGDTVLLAPRKSDALDCSMNGPQSDAYRYCHGRPVSQDWEYYGSREEDGTEVCWVCQPLGAGEASRMCDYRDTKSDPVLTCEAVQNFRSGKPADLNLGPPRCERPKDPDDFFAVERCNEIFENAVWTEGSAAIGRYDGENCGYCSIDLSDGGSCMVRQSQQCDELDSDNPSPQDTGPQKILCDSEFLHSYYEPACEERGSSECTTAMETQQRANESCPLLFDRREARISDEPVEATASYTHEGTQICAICNAERDPVDQRRTRCWINEDLPLEACS